MENTEYNDITKTGVGGLKGLEGVNTKKNNLTDYFNSLGRMNLTQLNEAFSPEGYTYIGQQLADAGYGESTYDEHAVTLSDLRDLNETRAQQLSGWAQIASGLGKMGILALTTFTDGVLGSIAGIVHLAGQAATGNIHSPKDALWNFIDNPFSHMLSEINERAESWLPNYYTQYELNSPWYSKIISANFLGDKFLKNVGFTIGAGIAATVTGGAAGRVLLKKGIRDAFKGVVVNTAGKELKTGAQIYRAYKTGDAIMDGIKLTEDLGKAAKQLRNAERRIKLIAGVTSAAGEARLEAINGAGEFKDTLINELENEHSNYPAKLEELLYLEHPEWFSVDSLGNRFISNFEGSKYYQELIEKEKENYEKARIQIDKEKVAVGNSIFGLNLALLSGGNIWQWGRAITGSFTAARTGQSLVKGSIKTGYGLNKNLIRTTRLRALSNPLMEAQEEMSQASIQEGSGMWKSSKINHDFGSFYGGKIDPDSEEDIQGWLGSILTGFANTYSDVDRWEEGFIGGLTGLLGIPKIKTITRANGKKGLSISIDGEFIQGFKDAKEYTKQGKEIAEKLNLKIQSPEFLNYYQGTIRHDALGDTMVESAEKGDEFEFKNAKHSLIISDAIMFEKAGKLQDFLDMIDETANLSEEDIKQIRQDTIIKKTGKSIFDGMSDEQVKLLIEKLAKNTKETVEKYAKMSTDLRALYGNDVSQDVLEEIIWGMTQVDNWENRLKLISTSIKDKLGPTVLELKDKYGIDAEVILNNFDDFNKAFFLEDEKDLVTKINEIVADKNKPIEQKEAEIIEAINNKKAERRRNNLALGRKIQSIRRKTSKLQGRLQKQISKLQEEKQRLSELRDAERLDHIKYIEERINSLLDEYSTLIKEIAEIGNNAPGFGLTHKESFERQINELFDKIDINSEGTNDYLDSVFSLIDSLISSLISKIEEEIAIGPLKDRRFKRGYDPTTKLVVGENGKLMSEAESEERNTTKAKNQSLTEKIAELKEKIEELSKGKINPIDAEDVNKKLLDMIKIMAARDEFLDTYQALSENPQLFDDKIQEKRDEAIREYREKQVKKELKKIKDKSFRNVLDLRKALEDIEDQNLVPEILETLKKEASDEVKKVIENYMNIEDMRDVLMEIISSFQSTTELQVKNIIKVAEIINDTLDEAKDYNDAKQALGTALNKFKQNNPDLAKIIDDILQKYSEILQAASSKKKDKKSKRKVKNRTNSKEEEEEEEEEGEEEEEEEEEEENTSNKKRSAFESLDEELGDNPLEDESEEEEDESEEEEDEDNSEEDEDDLIVSLKEMSEEELQDVIDDKSDILDGYNAADKRIIKQLATNILNRRKNPLVNFGRSVNSGETNSENDNSPSRTTQSVHRNWVVTGYNIDAAKSKSRKAVLYRSETADALRGLGAFLFVDSGRLGDLLYDNPKLPIHYIIAPNEKGLENVILLAIEVTPGVDAINPIIGHDGKKYQVVGTLGNYANDTTAYTNRKNIHEEIKRERHISGDTTRYFVSSKYVNTVSHIYSGRMIKSTETSDVQERNLKDILRGEEIYFGFYYEDDAFIIPGFPEEKIDRVVYPNKNNMNPREGSVWLMTKEADGRYYAKALSVRRFTNNEWDFNQHKDTAVMKQIINNIGIIFDPNASTSKRLLARDNLESLLYFGKYKILFKDDIVSIKDNRGRNIANNIGSTATSKEAKIVEMLNILKGLNLRFQVSPESSVLDIIDSDIISTDLAFVHNVNASFDMPMLDVETGKPLFNVNPSETRGHTGRRGVNNTDSVSVVYIKLTDGSSTKYHLHSDNTVTDERGNHVSKKITEQVLFMHKIINKKVQPVEGYGNFYVSAYSDSTKFGFAGGVLVEGKKLDDLIEKAKEEAEEKEAKKNRDTTKENFSNLDEDEDLDEDIDEDEDEDGDELSDEELFKDARRGFGERLGVSNFDEDLDEDEDFDEDLDEDEDEDDDENINYNVMAETQKQKDIFSHETMSLLASNMGYLNENGFGTIKAFIAAAAAKGIDVDSITTQEELNAAINKIKCK